MRTYTVLSDEHVIKGMRTTFSSHVRKTSVQCSFIRGLINIYGARVRIEKEKKNVTGHFITMEGGEGAGKTTILHRISNKLTKQGYDVITTREPGGIDISEQIRHIILDPAQTTMDARTEALLYAAARRQHLVERVIPALEQGKIVLCDRFIDSSLAYQGHARGLGIDEVFTINTFAIQNCMPACTLLLDIDPVLGLERIAANDEREQNRLDLEKLSFHERVYEGYQLLAERFPNRIHTINANDHIDEVERAVFEQIIQFLEKKQNEGRDTE